MKFIKQVSITGLAYLLFAGSLSACQSNPPVPFASEPSPTLSNQATSATQPNSPTLTDQGFGEVKINMSVEDAAKALGQPLVSPNGKPDTDESSCYYVKPEQGLEGLEFMVIDNQIARVDLTNPQISTLAGATVGDSEDQIKTLYPEVEVMPHKYTLQGHYMSVTPQERAENRLIFETDGIRVTSIRAGRLPEVEWVERCG